MKRQIRTCFVPLFLFLGLAAVAPSGAQRLPPYDFVEIPHPVTEEAGLIDGFFTVWLNQSDEVAGTARRPRDGVNVGFRFTPDEGLTVIDPGHLNTVIDGHGDGGHIFGRVLRHDPEGKRFRYHKSTGVEFLNKGLTKEIRKTFSLLDINKKGHVAGFTWHRDIFSPVIYTDADGWRNLRDIDPRFNRPGLSSVAMEINDDDEIVIFVSPPGGYEQPFLVTDTGVYDVGHLGTPVTSVQFQDDGSLLGCSRLPGRGQAGGADHAVIYRREEGRLIDIHPPARKYRHSCAFKSNNAGLVLGIVNRNEDRTRKWDLFRWDPRNGTRIRLTSERVAAIVPEEYEFVSWYVKGINAHLEMVGRIEATDPELPPFSNFVGIPFLHTPHYGLTPLQKLVDRAAPGLGVVWNVESINDRGTILVSILKPTPPPEPLELVYAMLIRRR